LLSVLTGGKSDLLSLTLGSTQITKAFSNEIRFNYSRNQGNVERQLDDSGARRSSMLGVRFRVQRSRN
jgi:hypothetical protein